MLKHTIHVLALLLITAHSSHSLRATPDDLCGTAPTPAIESVITAFDETQGKYPLHINTGRCDYYGRYYYYTLNGDAIALYNPKTKHMSIVLYEKSSDQFIVVVPGQERGNVTFERISTAAFRGYLLRNPEVRGYPLPKGKGVNDSLLAVGVSFATLGGCALLAAALLAAERSLRTPAKTLGLVGLACLAPAIPCLALMKSSRNYDSRDKVFRAALDAMQLHKTSDDDTISNERQETISSLLKPEN